MARRRLVLVAAMMRTWVRRVLLEPRRSNSPVCSTRRSLAWLPTASVPSSSRNRVPPSAASKRPARARAPVKAPASVPNSSASMSSCGQRAEIHLEVRAVGALGVGLHDIRQHLLAGAVRPGDQHRHVRVRHLRRHGDQGVHGLALVDDATQVEAPGERRARLGAPAAQRLAPRRARARGQADCARWSADARRPTAWRCSRRRRRAPARPRSPGASRR